MKKLLTLIVFLGCGIFEPDASEHCVQYWFRGDVAELSYTDGNRNVVVSDPGRTFIKIARVKTRSVLVELTTKRVENASASVAVGIDGLQQNYFKKLDGPGLYFIESIEILPATTPIPECP